MLFSENQAKILAILISQSEKDFSLSEIGSILEKHPGVFQRGINSLEKQGIIKSTKRRNLRLFKLNHENPFLEEIKGIVEKMVGAEGLLRKIVEDIKEITLALIYGSYAKRMVRPDSDIDVLIVTLDTGIENRLLDTITVVEKRIQREINFKIYTEEEFQTKINEKDPFLEEVLSDSDEVILLKGKI